MPTIHLTRDLAGLIAQVYPTLIIALLLEGRITSHSRSARIAAEAFAYIRLITILGALYITFVCLLIFGRKAGDDPVEPWLDAVNTSVMTLLLITISWAAGAILIRQTRDDRKKAHIAAVKAAEEQRRTNRFLERAKHTKDNSPDAYDN